MVSDICLPPWHNNTQVAEFTKIALEIGLIPPQNVYSLQFKGGLGALVSCSMPDLSGPRTVRYLSALSDVAWGHGAVARGVTFLETQDFK